jgi:hypothetical protein
MVETLQSVADTISIWSIFTGQPSGRTEISLSRHDVNGELDPIIRPFAPLTLWFMYLPRRVSKRNDHFLT